MRLVSLIGFDAYWQGATEKFDRISRCTTAIETTLGWMVQGPMKSDLCCPSGALFVVSRGFAKNINVSSLSPAEAITIDGMHSRTYEKHDLRSALEQLNMRHQLDDTMASGRTMEQSEMPGQRVDSHHECTSFCQQQRHGGNVDLARLLPDGHGHVLDIRHVEYAALKYARITMCLTMVGLTYVKVYDSRKSMTTMLRCCRKQTEWRARNYVLFINCESPLKNVSTADYRKNARGATVLSRTTSMIRATWHRAILRTTCLTYTIRHTVEKTHKVRL
ncbi:hypothetical protein HPB51_023601 [Rhipicephalus microplus]|uniref:Uncharacterized protein n=1 Tax=Rhipicephalus microplus TaxID=6941 RepID=A0A9J6DJR4_RHIMP|nr:hypothetical protein HPB51_023601 [Rhipicephalus microplus]